jgi:hypothetical protein
VSVVDRVKGLTGPNRDIDREIGNRFRQEFEEKNIYKRGHYPRVLLRVEKVFPAYTGSIDAAVALINRVLPGWVATLYGVTGCKDTSAQLSPPLSETYPYTRQDDIWSTAPTPALALLLALLSAKGGET